MEPRPEPKMAHDLTQIYPAGSPDSLANLPDQGIAVCHGGRIRWASQGLARLFRIESAQDLIGLSFPELLEDVGEGLPGHGSRLLECGLRGHPVRLVARGVGEGLAKCEETWSFSPAAETSLDRLEWRRLRGALREANRRVAALRVQLEAETSDREDLLNVVSHELRTPLTVLGGYTKLLLSDCAGALSDEQRASMLKLLNE